MGRNRDVQERTQFLRLLVKYVELTSEHSRSPECHSRLLAELRCQLANLEVEEAARLRRFQFVRFKPVRRLVSFVFGKARTV